MLIFDEVKTMIYVGIDAAKDKHFAVVCDEKGKILVKAFPFANSSEGFVKLQKALSAFDKDELLVGLESTGIYSENLIYFLFGGKYKLVVLNPLETAKIRAGKIRDTKNDKIDAKVIADTLRLNEHRLYSRQDADTFKLKTLCRFRQNLKKSKARLKIQLKGFVNLVFPELDKFFNSGIHIAACYALLKKFPTPEDVAALRSDTLTNLLSKASRGRFGKDTAKALKSLAKSSVGVKNPFISIQIAQTIAQIELLKEQIDELDTAISEAYDEIDSVIKTIPGVGSVNGAMILGEIGDVDRFSNPAKLLSYAGLDPRVRQSGNFQAKSARMSKRGSATLRYALINAAWQLSLHNETFNAYYDLKRSQGLNHYGALGHVAHKFVRVLFKLLRDDVPFEPAKLSA